MNSITPSSLPSKQSRLPSPPKPADHSPRDWNRHRNKSSLSSLSSILAPPPTARLHVTSHSDIARQEPPSLDLPDQYSSLPQPDETPTLHRRSRTETFQHRALPPLISHRKSNSTVSHTSTATESESASDTEDDERDEPILTGTRNSRARLDQRTNSIADWFNGSSDPVSLGWLGSPTATTTETELPTPPQRSRDASPTKSSYPVLSLPSSLRKMNKQPRSSLSLAGNGSSFFSSFLGKPPVELRSPPLNDDDLARLDITAALFPGGRPEDPYSPSAFKNLEQNARGILSRVHESCLDRSTSLQQVKSERDSAQERCEDLETKAAMLKAQVDELSLELQREKRALAAERQIRQEDEEARKKNLRRVRNSYAQPDQSCLNAPGSDRNSRISMNTLDSGFESGDETVQQDTLSTDALSEALRREESSNSILSSSSSFISTSHPTDQTPAPTTSSSLSSTTSVPTPTQAKPAPRPVTQLTPSTSGSVFQKMKNIVSAHAGPANGYDPSSPEAMTNEILVIENKMLKERIVGLEKTVDDCWDSVMAGLAGMGVGGGVVSTATTKNSQDESSEDEDDYGVEV